MTIGTLVSDDYNIKPKNSTINSKKLEEKDILICYTTKGILETFPGQIIVDELYYLKIKTDKDLSNAKLAERV